MSGGIKLPANDAKGTFPHGGYATPYDTDKLVWHLLEECRQLWGLPDKVIGWEVRAGAAYILEGGA